MARDGNIRIATTVVFTVAIASDVAVPFLYETICWAHSLNAKLNENSHGHTHV